MTITIGITVTLTMTMTLTATMINALSIADDHYHNDGESNSNGCVNNVDDDGATDSDSDECRLVRACICVCRRDCLCGLVRGCA